MRLRYTNNNLYLARKYARTSVCGHYLFHYANSYRERSPRKTVNFEEQIVSRENVQAHFRAKQRLLCLVSLKDFATRVKKCLRTVWSVRCFLWSTNFINNKISPFFCNHHKTFSRLELNLWKKICGSGREVWKLGNSTWALFSDIAQCSVTCCT